MRVFSLLSTWRMEREAGESEMNNYKRHKPTNTRVILHQWWHCIPLEVCEYSSDFFKNVFGKLVNWHTTVGELILATSESASYCMFGKWSLANLPVSSIKSDISLHVSLQRYFTGHWHDKLLGCIVGWKWIIAWYKRAIFIHLSSNKSFRANDQSLDRCKWYIAQSKWYIVWNQMINHLM